MRRERRIPAVGVQAGFMRSSARQMATNATDVGSALRAARERKGRSLEQLARTTRIRLPILRAIEANSRDELPPTIYLRAFIRAYAREVGMPPDETAAQYLEQFEAAVEPRAREATTSSGGQRSWQWSPAVAGRWERWSASMQWLTIVIVVACSFGAYRLLRSPEPRHPAAQASATQHGTDTPAPSKVGDAARRPEIGTSGAGDRSQTGTMRVQIRTDGACWVAATADGKRQVYRLMQPGESYEVTAERDIVLRVGDPGAFAFSIDGVEARPLGPHGRPVTARITRENYRGFLPQ
jgi:cytoskeletal protein RodZ